MIIKIRVIPASSQNIVVGFKEDVLQIKCRAIPEKGRANEAVISLLADYYHVKKSSIKILRGKTSLNKIVEILI